MGVVRTRVGCGRHAVDMDEALRRGLGGLLRLPSTASVYDDG